MKKDFVTLSTVTPADLNALLKSARALKSKRPRPSAGRPVPAKSLHGATVALLFEKPSLRTRVTFEVAISELGGRPVYLGPQEIGLGKRESVADVARNLSRWVHAIVARTFSHDTITELARHATVPVVNALTDREHPCQAVGDVLTVLDRCGRTKGLTLAFVGDGNNNVCHSLIAASVKSGMSVRVACPAGYEPDQKILKECRAEASRHKASIEIMRDPTAAVRGAAAVYTDVWVSMGFEDETEKRRRDFSAYQVNRALMSIAGRSAIFLHCLPARRGEEVTDEVMDGAQSAILDQAENRLHSAKAILLSLMASRRKR